MNKRYWHKLDKYTHPIGFGCWQIAGNHQLNGKPHGWGDTSTNQAVDLLVEAMDNQFDFFDTAQGYNFGKSEQILGQAIRESKKEVVVCTKIELIAEELENKKLEDPFRRRVDISLQNLQTDSIDVLLLHNPPDDIDWKNFDYSLLDKLVEENLIKSYGISSRSIKGAKNALDADFGSCIEWVLNIFERRPEEILFPDLKRKNINFIARSPLSRGLIKPDYLQTYPEFDKNDFRSTLSDDWLQWTIESLRQFHRNGVTPDELVQQAVAYCIDSEIVSSAIIGIKTPKQLENIVTKRENLEEFNRAFLNNIEVCYPKWS